MSDNERRIIDYDAFNDLPPNSWLIVDSEGQGTGKIAPIKIGATYEIQDGAHSFTLVGSNGYTHTVDIPYDSVQMSYEDYQALTEVQKMDGTNRFVPDVPTDDLEPEIWQRVGRTPLTTVEKTISPAINELKGRIDDSDTEIENIESNLTDFQESYIHKVDTKSVSANTVTKLVEINITSGIWLFTSHIILAGSVTGTYNHYLRDTNSLNNLTVRNAGTGGGGSSLSQIMDFPQATTVDVSVYVGTAATATGQISAIRIGDSLT